MATPRCILFDAVGTLIFADPPVATVYQQAGERHGVALPLDEIARHFRASFTRSRTTDGIASSDLERQRWRSVISDVFREAPAACPAILDELWQHFSQPSAWRLYDDAIVALDELSQAGWQLGVASNFDERLVSVCRGHAELAKLPLFWSTHLGFSKPHPEFFAAVARCLQLAPRELLLVGDDLEADVRGGLAAGWQVVHIDRESPTVTPPAIRTLAELPALLAAQTAGG